MYHVHVYNVCMYVLIIMYHVLIDVCMYVHTYVYINIESMLLMNTNVINDCIQVMLLHGITHGQQCTHSIIMVHVSTCVTI